MDDKKMEKAEKKLREGWIKAWMMIECLAISPDAAKSALETHIRKMGNEKKIIIYKKDFKEIKEIEKPMPGKNIEKGYSLVVEVELVSANFETLVSLVMNYGPSALEILEPGRLSMEANEAQGILNSISDMMHSFAATGAGGVVVQT